MKINKKARTKNDLILIFAIFCLCVIGCIFVYSASYYVAEKDYADKFYFLKKQIIGYLIGAVAFAVASVIDYRKFKKYSFWFFIFSLILLVLVLTPLGREVYGAKRWIGIGGITVQPSDIAKLSFVIFISAYFSNDISKVKTVKGCLPIILAGAVTCLLIIAEPNMSITVCVGALMLAMLFIAGIKIKHLIIILLPILLAIPLLIILEPYRLKRFTAFLNPWASPQGEGYQLLQSLYALGSGGLFGVGIFNSRQKMRFLPFAESDFILSIIGEECGFFGVIFLFFIAFIIVWRVIKIAKNCNNFFGYLLSMGIACIFLIQIAVNALVVTGSIPPTGLPFPLVSSGNTQIIVFLASFGIVNSVKIHKE